MSSMSSSTGTSGNSRQQQQHGQGKQQREQRTRRARHPTCGAAASPRAARVASVVRCIERHPVGLRAPPHSVSSVDGLHCASCTTNSPRWQGSCGTRARQAGTALTTVKGRSCDRPDALGQRYVTEGVHGTGAASGGALGLTRPSSDRRRVRGGIRSTNSTLAVTVGSVLAPAA